MSGDCFYAALAAGLGYRHTMETVRELSVYFLASKPLMTKWVYDPQESRRLEETVFVFRGTLQYVRSTRAALMGDTLSDSEKVELYLSVKGSPGTYANIPMDTWAVSCALGIDIFVLNPSQEGNGCFMLWMSPVTYTSEM